MAVAEVEEDVRVYGAEEVAESQIGEMRRTARQCCEALKLVSACEVMLSVVRSRCMNRVGACAEGIAEAQRSAPLLRGPPALPRAANTAGVQHIPCVLRVLQRHTHCVALLPPPCAAAEVLEVRNAVAAIKSSLEAMRANTEPSKSNMLRLNLREARDILARRLAEAAPPVNGSSEAERSLVAAKREAQALLDEVDQQFFKGG
jgi:hypothetical protein